MITTGEGGMVLTRDEFIDKYAREYHDHGHENNPNLPRGKDTHSIQGFNYRMTELQGSLGKVQLKKLPIMIEDNKKRYLSLYDEIKNKFKIRPILSSSSPTYDTLIIIEEKKEIREKIIDILKLTNIGTKNLPDAMEWHCASYWDHILSSNQINEISKSKEILDNCVAIPIWLKKTQSDYSKLGVKLKSI